MEISQQNLQTQKQQEIAYDIIVIGAGIAGLSVANELIKQEYKVKILEAREVYGGRISKKEGFASFSIESGGEEIHNKESAYFYLAKSLGANLIEEISNSTYFIELPDKQEMISEHDFFEKYPQWDIWRLAELEYQELSTDVSIKDFLIKHGIFDKVGKFYQNLLGSENGTDISKISLKGVLEYDEQFDKSHHHMITNMSHFDIITKAFSQAIDVVQCNSIVQQIDYTNTDTIKVTTTDNQVYFSKQVLLTIPLSIFKKQSIQFIPPLSQDKLSAISEINMGISGKLQTKYKERFWGSDFNSIITWDNDFGMTWNSSLCKELTESNVLTSLLVDEVAIKMNDETIRQELINKFLLKLAAIFKNDRIPELYEGYLWTEYSSMEHIEGSYTTPTLHQKKERIALSEPIQNRIFFAGEATSLYNHSTIHGAYESGLREAQLILATKQP